MQPLQRKQTSLWNCVARARVLLRRDAAWLPGSPIKTTTCKRTGKRVVVWLGLEGPRDDEPSLFEIDGESLRRAQLTISKLRHHFPHALTKIFPNTDDWLSRIDFVFEALKDAIHRGVALNADLIYRGGVLPDQLLAKLLSVKAVSPRIAPLLDSLVFAALSSPTSNLRESFDWNERHAIQLERLVGLQQDVPLLLYSVREQLPEALLEAITLGLANPLFRDCKLKAVEGTVPQLRKQLGKVSAQYQFVQPRSPDGESLGQLLVTTFRRFCKKKPKHRKRSLAFLAQVLTPELVSCVIDHQESVSANERALRRVLRRVQSGHEIIPHGKSGHDEWVEKINSDLPSTSKSKEAVVSLGSCLHRIKDCAGNTDSLARFLCHFPQQDASLRIRLLDRWRYQWIDATDPNSGFHRVLTEFSKLFHRRGIPAALLQHWSEYADGERRHFECVTETSSETGSNTARLRRVVRLLERLVYDRKLELGPKLLCSLTEFTRVSSDDAGMASLIELVAKKRDEFYFESEIRTAMFFGDSAFERTKILSSLKANGELNGLATDLVPLAEDCDLKRLVASRLARNETATLVRLAMVVGLLTDLGLALPKCETVSHSARWAARYPQCFRPRLIELASATPEAERIAENLLGKIFRRPESLQEQIRTMKEKLAAKKATDVNSMRLQRRINNLEQRFVDGMNLSAKRKERLEVKLRHRAEEEKLRRFSAACKQKAMGEIVRRHGLREFPHELLISPIDRVLRETNRLEAPMRLLGSRLLFETLSGKTKSFDEEPKNAKFRQRMHSSGINMGPWLNDELRTSATTADGVSYEVAFTRDVRDFLLMGFHFNTCLSPDSFNFLSTIANAVDINKRVVYGKTAAGKVIGRCLFALNDQGEILTYHRYSHQNGDGFSEAVDQFARQLAREMQTCVGTMGQVSKLVASDWYDDGVCNGNAHWFGDDDSLRKLVDQVPSEDLLAELLNATGENALKKRIIDVATDARLCNQSHFLHALLDRFGNQISSRIKLILAVNLHAADVSERLLCELSWSEIVRIVHRYHDDQCGVLHGIADAATVFRVLTNHNPTLGLRAIRATRPNRVRDDLVDQDRTRLFALAHAHRQLGRMQLAEKLSERCAAVSPGGS